MRGLRCGRSERRGKLRFQRPGSVHSTRFPGLGATCRGGQTVRQFVSAEKRGFHPAFSFAFGLSPVALNQDPAVVAMNPAMGHPDRVGMRRSCPVSGNPDVARAVPLVVAGDPNPARMRRRAVMLDDGCRRPYMDHNPDLGHCSRRCETKSEQNCQCDLFHRICNLRGFIVAGTGDLFRTFDGINSNARCKLRSICCALLIKLSQIPSE